MEIIEFLAEDGFTHYLLFPTMGINFTLWIIMLGAVISLISCLFSKIMGCR